MKNYLELYLKFGFLYGSIRSIYFWNKIEHSEFKNYPPPISGILYTEKIYTTLFNTALCTIWSPLLFLTDLHFFEYYTTRRKYITKVRPPYPYNINVNWLFKK